VTKPEVRAALALILSVEEDWPIDWRQVQYLSANLASNLCTRPPEAILDPFVFEFLTGWELRRRDPNFAHSQRGSLAAFVRGGP
jgi:hypothetical protein